MGKSFCKYCWYYTLHMYNHSQKSNCSYYTCVALIQLMYLHIMPW